MFDVLRLRHRVDDRSIPRVVDKAYRFSSIDLSTGQRYGLANWQSTMISEGTYGEVWDQSHGKPPYNTGGPFFQYRKTRLPYLVGPFSAASKPRYGGNSDIPAGHPWSQIFEGYFYTSNVLPEVPGMSIQSPNDHDSNVNPDDLTSVGNRAYARLRPKVEIATLFQDIYELKDVPGMLHTSAKGFRDIWKSMGGGNSGSLRFFKENYKMFPKKTGDHFLNVQFGWKPFIQSINNVCDVVVNFDDYVAKRTRQNNRWMPRKFREPRILNEVLVSRYTDSNNGCFPYMDDQDWTEPNSGIHETFRETLMDIWYSGEFKFYREEFDAGLRSEYPTIRQVRQMLTLLGLEINPVNLYKVTPWTWLVDWFANVGDAVQRFQDMADGTVVSKYFYLMRHTYDRYRYRTRWSNSFGGQNFDLSWYQGIDCKMRVGSEDPFNFALVPAGLSRGQLMILAALGLSRQP